jgi:bifunctional non-homologous end joining protein LigD
MEKKVLEDYKKKRDFKRTSEPSPHARAESRPGSGPLTFVVQKHASRRLHFDFRLELDGVLKSWAVPNGPSSDPGVKRLAVMVEDHPLDYGSFEGTIPAGEYGAGQVIVWDKGTYTPTEDNHILVEDRAQAETMIRQGLAKGKISVLLYGQRLKGSWALVKMQRSDKNWLLIKHRDEFAKPDEAKIKEGTSLISGLSTEELKAGKKIADYRPDPPKLSDIPGAVKTGFPDSISPMLASLVQKPFSDPDWIFEPKLDGYRTISYIHRGKAKLVSRNGIDVSAQYPSITSDLEQQTTRQLVLDGEIVALDEKGRSCFQCLQNHLKLKTGKSFHSPDIKHQIIYYVFDILYLSGYSLVSVPLQARKELLTASFTQTKSVRLVEYFEKDGTTLYKSAVSQGLEGIIAKRKDSLYDPGQRSHNWLKIKSVLSNEFVITGYTQGTGNRAGTFGSLILGSYNEKEKLVFAGHVGTGFDDRTLSELRKRLDALRNSRSPFPDKVNLNAPAVWVRPELVAEVKFSEKTRDGLLRAPVFLRLREDKASSEVISIQDPPVHVRTNKKNALPGANPESVLRQLQNPEESFILEVEGNKISLSHLDKALWPAENKQPAITKRDLLVYLTRISPFLLPHLQDRPLTLTRYPDGIHREHFFQKHWDSPAPPFLNTVPLAENSGATRDYLVCHNLSTLLWLGQIANIDLHTWFSRTTPEPGLDSDDYTQYPDFIVFDLDPYIYSGKEAAGDEPELNRKAFTKTCEAALWLKDILDDLKLPSFIKTSGKTGLHIFVPLKRQFDYEVVHSAAKTVSGFLYQKHPDKLTTEWAVEKRTGKIFLDYNQNVRGKTLASIYSPRPAPLAPVSTPLRWDEVGKVYPTDFTMSTVPARVAKIGDLWKNILDKPGDLKKITGATNS